MEQAYGYMLDVRNTDNVTCRKYRHSSHLKFIPFHISLAMESHFCGPVTAEALPRKVRVVRTFFETYFFFYQKQESLSSVYNLQGILWWVSHHENANSFSINVSNCQVIETDDVSRNTFCKNYFYVLVSQPFKSLCISTYFSSWWIRFRTSTHWHSITLSRNWRTIVLMSNNTKFSCIWLIWPLPWREIP